VKNLLRLNRASLTIALCLLVLVISPEGESGTDRISPEQLSPLCKLPGVERLSVLDHYELGNRTVVLVETRSMDGEPEQTVLLALQGTECTIWRRYTDTKAAAPEEILGSWQPVPNTKPLLVLKMVRADEHDGVVEAIIGNPGGTTTSVPFGGWSVGDISGRKCDSELEQCKIFLNTPGKVNIQCRLLCVREEGVSRPIKTTEATYCWGDGTLAPCQ